MEPRLRWVRVERWATRFTFGGGIPRLLVCFKTKWRELRFRVKQRWVCGEISVRFNYTLLPFVPGEVVSGPRPPSDVLKHLHTRKQPENDQSLNSHRHGRVQEGVEPKGLQRLQHKHTSVHLHLVDLRCNWCGLVPSHSLGPDLKQPDRSEERDRNGTQKIRRVSRGDRVPPSAAGRAIELCVFLTYWFSV